jgi:crotonobetainyl-CoA:carnitine CoA-transferase CaiB-like acyl-CoA transferase
VITGLHVGLGVLAALRHRDATGHGQRVEANLMSSAMSALVNQAGAYMIGGVVPTRMGNEHPSLYPYGPMPTGDGQLIVAAGNDRQFARLCEALERTDLRDDPRFATVALRNRNRGPLGEQLAIAFEERSAQTWFERLREFGVPCAPIQDIAQGVATATELGLDPVARLGDGSVVGARHPLDFSLTPTTYELAAPALDRDSDAIRRWLVAVESRRRSR